MVKKQTSGLWKKNIKKLLASRSKLMLHPHHCFQEVGNSNSLLVVFEIEEMDNFHERLKCITKLSTNLKYKVFVKSASKNRNITRRTLSSTQM